MKYRLHLLLFFAFLFGCGYLHADSRVALQKELVRGHYLSGGTAAIYEAFKLRLNKYTRIRTVNFMGKGFLMHEVVQEPLSCVERYIKSRCESYEIKNISGWRPENSFKAQADYRQQEYSNHIFGLALDINPNDNPCCGCVKAWAKNPRCLEENGAQVFEVGAPIGAHTIPACWVEAFKQYGFHWLGDDVLRDTMHFEFLAEPGSVGCP